MKNILQLLFSTSALILYTACMYGCGSKQESKTIAAVETKDTLVEETNIIEEVFNSSASVKATDYMETATIEARDPGNLDTVLAGYLERKDRVMILISMHLKGENGNLSGKYFYESTSAREDITVRGNLEGDSLMLVEFDPQNRITGRFNGNYISPTAIEGFWSNPDGKKKLPFKLEYNDMPYDQRKIIGIKADPEEE